MLVRNKLQWRDILRFLQSLQVDTTMDVGNARNIFGLQDLIPRRSVLEAWHSPSFLCPFSRRNRKFSMNHESTPKLSQLEKKFIEDAALREMELLCKNSKWNSLLLYVHNNYKQYSFWYISNEMQLYTVYLFLEKCSTCFGLYLHPSSD